jgi:Bacterial HORMA domain family 1
MTSTYTTTDSFTLIHARKLAAKVAADMDQCRRLYGEPSSAQIEAYREELVVMLHGRYVSKYEFGYQTSDERRVVTWLYTVTAYGDLSGGQRSGGLYSQADTSNATMFNFLTTNADWSGLGSSGQDDVKKQHSIRRVTGEPPTDGNGRWVRNKTYSAGGVAIARQEFRPW